MNNEIYKDIRGYEGLYKISNFGNVKSLNYNRTKSKRIMKPGMSINGYPQLLLHKNGKRRMFKIHRLVALAFIKNLLNLPQINHKDGNKKNNNVENLEWCNAYQNTHHAYQLGLINTIGEKNPNTKIKESDVAFIRKYLNSHKKHGEVTKLAKQMGISRQIVSNVKNNYSWNHVK